MNFELILSCIALDYLSLNNKFWIFILIHTFESTITRLQNNFKVFII